MTTELPSGQERRREPRVPVTVKGRFLAPDGNEHPCAIRDMSLSGIALICDAPIDLGAHLIIYLDDFGRFEGDVVRTFEGGFAIVTALSGARRERVAAWSTCLSAAPMSNLKTASPSAHRSRLAA